MQIHLSQPEPRLDDELPGLVARWEVHSAGVDFLTLLDEAVDYVGDGGAGADTYYLLRTKA